MTIKIITESDVLEHISMRDSIHVVEKAFLDYSLSKSKMPSKVYLDLPEFNGDFRAMPAYEHSQQFAGVKWVNVHTKNKEKGLPTVMGTIILNNPETAEPLAIVEATALTALRTGAASGVASKYLAVPSACTLALIGAGIQSFYQAEAIDLVRNLKLINIYDINKDAAESLKENIKTIFEGEIIINNSIQDAVEHSDIVVTTTPSRTPILKKVWLKKHVHINAIGADAEGKRECDDDIMSNAQIVIDEYEQATHSGEINIPFKNKLLIKKDIKATIGEVIVNNTIVKPEEMTLFDSTGLAIQDIALAGFLYKKLIS